MRPTVGRLADSLDAVSPAVASSDERVFYLDNAASTPVRPEALEALLPMLSECYANPSGAHRMARDARRRLDDARDVLAEGLACNPGEIVFTAGGTEADNLAVFGVHSARGGVTVCSATEHHAVLRPVEHLGGRLVRVDELGRLDLDHLADLLDDEVTIVSVGLVNGETGVIQDLDAVAGVVRTQAPGAVLHTDAVQAMPWLDVGAVASSADLISIAGHKFGAPKGVGALVIREGVDLAPQLLGGGQERGSRSGTHNAPGIVAMAAAAKATWESMVTDVPRLAALRDRLADGLRDRVSGTHESGVPAGDVVPDRSGKIAGSCHVCFEGIESEALLVLLERDGILASAASSCASGAQDPSHVLAAMGWPRELAQGSLRLSLGYATTDAEVDAALASVPPAVADLRRTGS
jgi:cysteine desulfurase